MSGCSKLQTRKINERRGGGWFKGGGGCENV